MKYKKALVTGGAGFIGSHIAEKLLELGIEVTIIDDLSMGKLENVPKKSQFIKGDITNFNLLKNVIHDNVDIIFHEAAKVSIRNSIHKFYDDAQINLLGTLNILRACNNSKVKKIIYASSMAIYDDSKFPTPLNENYRKNPLSPYGVSKLASELYGFIIAKRLRIDFISLRYFNTFGLRQTYTPYVGVITIFINRLLQGKPPIIFGDGKQKRDFIYVKDVVQANIKAMLSNISSDAFNIGTGISTSVNEIAELLCSKINPHLKPIYSKTRPEEPRNSIADISKAQSLLGFCPKYKLENKIDEVIDYIALQKKNNV